MERLQIKLLIDGGAKRVVFAEADKDFVDFLFRILSLPMANFFGLLGRGATVGSLTNLHVSIDKLNDYTLPAARDPFLAPAAPPRPRALPDLLPCYVHYGNPSDLCRTCVRAAARAAAGTGFSGKKSTASYMVMDDLTVSPMSISELRKLNVNSVADLQETIVFVGKVEAVKLLSASLHSKNVLTDVFLKITNKTSDPCTPEVKRETVGVKRERTT